MATVNPFKTNKDTTRTNSMLSKFNSVSALFDLGCRRIQLHTCPGPSVEEEKEEAALLQAAFQKKDPAFSLRCNYWEIDPDIIEHFNIEYGELTTAVHRFVTLADRGLYDGLIFEWDGVDTHRTNSKVRPYLEYSRWETAMDAIEACPHPVAFAYTHCPRGDKAHTDNPTEADLSKPVHSISRQPWEGFFRDILAARHTEAPTLIWSSRNHWDKFPGAGSRGIAMYRWVWLFE